MFSTCVIIQRTSVATNRCFKKKIRLQTARSLKKQNFVSVTDVIKIVLCVLFIYFDKREIPNSLLFRLENTGINFRNKYVNEIIELLERCCGRVFVVLGGLFGGMKLKQNN